MSSPEDLEVPDRCSTTIPFSLDSIKDTQEDDSPGRFSEYAEGVAQQPRPINGDDRTAARDGNSEPAMNVNLIGHGRKTHKRSVRAQYTGKQGVICGLSWNNRHELPDPLPMTDGSLRHPSHHHRHYLPHRLPGSIRSDDGGY
jgi:hypothetical protein